MWIELKKFNNFHAMNRFKISWLWVVILALLCSSSCQKDPNPEFTCDDGTCCGEKGYQYKRITAIENAPADYGNGGFWLKNPVNRIQGVLVCFNRYDKVQTLEKTYFPNDPNPPYRYRIWGEIYHNLSTIGFYPDPIYEIRIDKIEIVN
jgi:hypothetical protein